MAQATNLGSGEGWGKQGADPKPFLGGGWRVGPAPSVMSLGHLLLGADHPHGLRMILDKRQSLLLPETHFVGVALLAFVEGLIGLARLKQAHGILLEIAVLLFQGKHPIPVDLLGQLEERRLSVEGVELKDVKEAAAVKLGQPSKEAEARPVLAFAGMKPLDGREGLDRATDELAAHRYPPALFINKVAVRNPCKDWQAIPTCRCSRRGRG